MNDIPLHDMDTAPDDLPLFVSQIEMMDEVIQTPEPDRHTFHEVLWIKQGQGQHHIDFEDYKIQPNTLFFIAAGQIHFWNVPRRSHGYVLLFTDELFHLSGTATSALQNFVLAHDRTRAALSVHNAQVHAFDQLFERLLDEYTAQREGWRTAMQALIQLLLIQAQRLQSSATPLAKLSAGIMLARHFRALVEQKFARDHTVQPYALALSVTSGHLTDTVRAVTGLSAGDIIRRRIVLEAKRLLIHSDDTIEMISAQLCFKNASYFNRFFRRETGLSPAAFRHDFRKKYPLARG
jgi:AraC family transcriptional regulator, transcriptional activator of pobA